MCGRFTLEPTARFYERFQIANRLERIEPRYNIAPSQEVPIIIKQSPNKVMMMKWGLIPHWAKDSKIGYKTINARAETIADKPMFRSSLKSKRCLVPASGFYEWQTTQQGKIPHYIHLNKEALFAFAGLYDIWKNEKEQEVYTFTIITTSPNTLIEKIHNRMPVILKESDEDKWLDTENITVEIALKMLAPYRASGMEAYPISRKVNSPENDTPDLIVRTK